MNAEEKVLINNLLDTAYSWAAGYPVGICSGKESPKFTDDVAIQSKDATTEKNEISNQQKTEASITIPENFNTLDNIITKIRQCTRCPLCKSRKNVVPGMGVPKPLVMIIGEAPGAEEDQQGLPFVGAAGQLLDKMLNAIQLDRNSNCYIANILKCRPPMNRDPLPEEADSCRSFLDAQIQILRPKMILAMGRIASQHLLKTSEGINKLRGKFYDYKGIPVLPTYHPSALLRDTALKAPAWEDLKAFRTRLNSILQQE